MKMTLTDRVIRQISRPGIYSDGTNGLRLQVTENKRMGGFNRSWIVRFRIRGGTTHDMGLGPFPVVGLADARAKAREIQKAANDGLNPIVIRDTRAAPQTVRTFKQCAEQYIKLQAPGWSNQKHAAQWASTLERYVFPVFGDVAIEDVDIHHVKSALAPIWESKPETASRVRQRIDRVLSWSAVQRFRDRENPAQWRGLLQHVFPAPRKVKKVEHHPALAIDELPDFMKELRKRDALGALAFEFCILSATRTSETLKAKWDEIDRVQAVWTIPADRMKAKRPHRVPLTDRMLAILDQVRALNSEYIFPGKDHGPLSNGVFAATLNRMGREDITAHGFRSTFRDWVAERTEFANELAEAALSHTIQNKAEAAYRRQDMLDRRRVLMAAWCEYCLYGFPPQTESRLGKRRRRRFQLNLNRIERV